MAEYSDWTPVDFGGDTQAPAPAAPAPATPQAGYTDWHPIDVDFGFTPVVPPKPGIGAEFGRGVVRGGVNALVYPAAEGALHAGGALGYNVNEPTQWLHGKEEQFNQQWAPSVPSVTDIGGTGDAARYAAGKVGEFLPLLGGYAAASAAGGPAGALGFGAIQGALQGATEAAKRHNNDPGAAAVGATIGALAGGAPVHFLMGHEGQGLIRSIVQGALGMSGIGVAQTAAEPLAGVAAGQGYETPSPAQFADAAVSGGILGGVLGGIGGLRRPAPRPDVELSTTGISPDQQVALNETLRLPPPQRQLPAPDFQQPMLALPRPETTYGDGFTARPSVPDQAPLMLPRPETGYGDNFTMPPPYTLAVPLDPRLTGPAQYPALTPPDLSRGTAGDNFTVQRPAADAAPAAPSGGMNRGHLIDALTELGQTPTRLKRMPIGELRQTYDNIMASPAPLHDIRPTEPQVSPETVAAWRPTTTVAIDDRAIPDRAVPPSPEATPLPDIRAAEAVARRADTSTDQTSAPAAAAPADARPQEAPPPPAPANAPRDRVQQAVDQYAQPVAALMTTDQARPQTVADRMRARRQMQKQQMAEAPTRLVKKSEAPVRKPETEIRPDLEEEINAEVGDYLTEGETHSRPKLSEETPAVFESEKGPVEVAPVPEGGKERGRESFANLMDWAKDLERRVVNGDITATEAHKLYGEKHAGPGRGRKYPTFAEYLKERIEKAPEAERDILDKGTRVETDKTLAPESRAAQLREINAEREHHSPDRVDHLSRALDEIQNPPEPAAPEPGVRERAAGNLSRMKAFREKKAAEDTTHRSPSGWDVADSASDYVPAYDKRLHRSVTDLLGKSSPEGDSVHKYLDAIANDPVVRVRLPQSAALARRLKSLLPEDLKVYTIKHAAERFDDSRLDIPTAAGLYSAKHRVIALNDSKYSSLPPIETMLHETVHAATVHLVDRLPKDAREIRALEAIREELVGKLEEGMPDFSTLNEVSYAASRPSETITMLMTNPTVQAFAAKAPVSREFRAKMTELGYGLGPVKSIWNTFTHWARKTLGLPQGSETLLDHALRPLQDIIDRGAKFLPKDPELRRAAAPAADAAIHALPNFDRGKLRDEALTRLDPKGLSDKLRRAWLQATTLDNMVTHYRDLMQEHELHYTKDGKPVVEQHNTLEDATRRQKELDEDQHIKADIKKGVNHLENFRTAAEAEQHVTKELRSKYLERANTLIEKIKGPERDAVASLMNDATLADVKLGPKADNSHVKDTKTLDELQRRYDALPDAAKKTYHDWNRLYEETYSLERGARLESLIKLALPDADKAQTAALVDQVRTKRGIKQLIDNPDSTPVAAAFAQAWHDKRSLVREIARVHDMGYVQGDYFRLGRFGDYVVTYGSKEGGDYGVEMFERRRAAEMRRDELLKADLEPSDVQDKRKSYLRSLVPEGMMRGVNEALVKSKFTDEERNAVRDAFASAMMQYAGHSEAARSRARRQGIKGASLDVERTLAKDMLDFTARTGYLKHGPERMQALDAMHRHADYLGRNRDDGSNIPARAIVNELEKRAPRGDDAAPGTLAHHLRRFSSFGFAYSLMSPSHLAVNSLEAHMNAISLLGARHGAARAGLALAKAMKDITPQLASLGAKNTVKAFGAGLKEADWNLAHHARDQFIKAGAKAADMNGLFAAADDAGLIDHSAVREMQRIARPGLNLTRGWWDRLLDFDGAMQHAGDVANKSAILKATYDLERRNGADHLQAIDAAVEMARKAMPNYNVVNKARIATDAGPLRAMAAPIMQFKNYGLHMYGVLANLAHESMHGASAADRREAQKAFAGILATRSLAAGTLTLIADPLRWIGGLYDWITGAQRPHDYQSDARRWAADAFGPELGEIFSRGVLHAIGIDIHRRLGLDNMLNFPDLETFSTKGYAQAFATAVSGAAGQDAAQMAGGLNKIINGDIRKGVTDFIPVRMARDLVKAGYLNAEGVVDGRGRPILPAEKLSPADIASQALGFQPAKVSEFREKRAAILEAREETKSERGGIINRYAGAVPEDRADIMDQVREYNQAHPAAPITRAQLLSAIKQRQDMARSSQTAGIRLPKKQAAELTRAGSFANAP